MKRFTVSLFLAALIVPASLSAFSLTYEGVQGEIGLLWKMNEGYDTQEGDSGPDTLTFTPGVSFFFSINENWFMRPSVFYYGQTLEYLPEREYAIPVDYSNINSLYVAGLFMQPGFGYRFIINEKHTIGLQTSPALNIQVPTFGPGSSDRADMFSSLIKEFLYWTFSAWYYNPLTERFGFSFKLEAGIPLYNLYLGRGLPFNDGMMFGFQVGIRVLADR
ncbi:MAG: hypothetical protein PQJ50_12925 [Spirochaetales bacterium]|nr:hypothetical protein [Spirochaetales bacterium]